MKKLAYSLVPVACSVFLSGCATRTLPQSPAHIKEAPRAAGAIPEPVQQSAVLPPPRPTAKVETYSVTVHKVAVQSLLFALARDAGLNVDVHPGVEGNVTLNALDQTLPQLLSRIQRQVDMRYEISNGVLTVLPDTPEWRNYKVDYVNIARSTSSSVNIATQISTTGGGGGAANPVVAAPVASGTGGTGATGAGAGGGAAASNPSNNSTTVVNNRGDNNFWYSLEKNIRDMLRPTTLNDKLVDPLAGAPLPAPGQPGQSGQASATAQQTPSPFDGSAFGANRNTATTNSVIVNAEGGLIAVRATGRQHEKIREFLDIVVGAAKRQVLIEATVIEVRLSNNYQQGITWSSIAAGQNIGFSQRQVGATLPSGVAPGTSPGIFTLNFLNPTGRLGNLTAAIQLLESFGKVKVLSSPKISVMNNQTALLKVVDNNVFFSIKVTPAVLGANGNPISQAIYESKLETVPVGFVMSVTPQISDSDEVTINVRPTITRIVGYVDDPNPALGSVRSRVPVIQARELESLMKVPSGQIAVMGGLMQDSVDNAKDGVPLLSSLPVVGDLFSFRNETSTKTELVIFMRPVVIKDASVNGDYKDYRYLLPGETPDTAPYPETVPYPVPTAKANGS
ncbi:MAG: type II and III secretion system protein [Duganella sp.]